MELKHSSIIRSPGEERRVRLIGEVSYRDRSIGSEIYWFEAPEKFAESLSMSGNPWLVCLLPLAVTLGEPLRIHRPVDRVLFENAQELMRIWKCWYPHLHIVPIEADVDDAEKQQPPSKTASFFSGGVDSFFTVLRHNNIPSSDRQIDIDDLLLVWGFDIPLRNSDAFARIRDTLRKAASDLGKELIAVSTNVGAALIRRTDWPFLSVGCGLASVALAMEKRYSRALMASGHGYENLTPWGSHPLTDPLLSTSRTRIIHDGAAFNRIEKTEFIAGSDVAMRSLHVCWVLQSDENCSACNKCYRTMTTLALLGALPRCTTFKEGSVDEKKIPRIYSRGGNDRFFLRQVRDFALRKGRPDIARAIDRSIRYSRRFDKRQPLVKWLERNRLGWILDAARKLRQIEDVSLFRGKARDA